MEKSEYLNECQRRTIHPSTVSTPQVLQCAYRTTQTQQPRATTSSATRAAPTTSLLLLHSRLTPQAADARYLPPWPNSSSGNYIPQQFQLDILSLLHFRPQTAAPGVAKAPSRSTPDVSAWRESSTSQRRARCAANNLLCSHTGTNLLTYPIIFPRTTCRAGKTALARHAGELLLQAEHHLAHEHQAGADIHRAATSKLGEIKPLG